MEMQHGKIAVESSVGRGTTVRFSVPGVLTGPVADEERGSSPPPRDLPMRSRLDELEHSGSDEGREAA